MYMYSIYYNYVQLKIVTLFIFKVQQILNFELLLELKKKIEKKYKLNIFLKGEVMLYIVVHTCIHILYVSTSH